MPIRIGVIGTSDIAKRRMIPAIKKCKEFEYAGVAIAGQNEWNILDLKSNGVYNLESKIQKAKGFEDLFGGKTYLSYNALLDDSSIDAVYIPLPPALHFYWAKKALDKGKHVLLEKPLTVSLQETKTLIDIASNNNLALTENYGFVYHSQFEKLQQLFKDGKIGSLRLIRATFGFPHRAQNDFRYSKELGGGALLDCGGYVIKAACCFMNSPKIVASSLTVTPEHEVDIYGSITLQDKDLVAQLSFGMDNSYKCDFELWGSTGALISTRAYTAPDNFDSSIILSNKDGNEEISCGKDDQFGKTLINFSYCINDSTTRENEIKNILKHEELLFQALSTLCK